ncbi:sensor histidine kinase [Bradyrhizobium japonicum]
MSTRIPAAVDKLPYASQLSVLRVIQEALTNIFRHAKATEVRIVVEAIEGHFHLTISDNGRGFPIHHTKRGNGAISPGVGIPAMRARLKQLGARSRSGPILHRDIPARRCARCSRMVS